jgi:hypothetical protein
MSERYKRFLIGLVVGFTLGYLVSYPFLLLFNWSCQWTGKGVVVVSPWSGILLGILVALSMGINMMNPPFAD